MRASPPPRPIAINGRVYLAVPALDLGAVDPIVVVRRAGQGPERRVYLIGVAAAALARPVGKAVRGKRVSKALPQEHRLPVALRRNFRTTVTPIERPRTRADCAPCGRPGDSCPLVGCTMHLALDVSPIGTITLNVPWRQERDWVPELTFDPRRYTCALAFAEDHPEGGTLDDVGAELALVRERVRQIEDVAQRKARDEMRRRGIAADDLALPDRNEWLPLSAVSGLTSAIGRSFSAEFGRRLRAAGWRSGGVGGWRMPDGRDVPPDVAWRMAAKMEATNG